MNSLGQKACTKCKQVKDFSQFNICRANKDGLQNWCKECKSAEAKGYRSPKEIARSLESKERREQGRRKKQQTTNI